MRSRVDVLRVGAGLARRRDLKFQCQPVRTGLAISQAKILAHELNAVPIGRWLDSVMDDVILHVEIDGAEFGIA